MSSSVDSCNGFSLCYVIYMLLLSLLIDTKLMKLKNRHWIDVIGRVFL